MGTILHNGMPIAMKYSFNVVVAILQTFCTKAIDNGIDMPYSLEPEGCSCYQYFKTGTKIAHRITVITILKAFI